MNNFFKSVLLVALSVFVVSCSKDSTSTEPLRDYATQYATDIANIETFMKTHYMEVDIDQNVTDTNDSQQEVHKYLFGIKRLIQYKLY